MTVTIEEVDELAIEVRDLYLHKKELELKAEEAKKEYNKKAFELITILVDHDKKNVTGSFGKVTLVEKAYFKITDYDQAMDWLKEDGTYESLRKVSAADFSKRVAEVAVEEGPNKTKLINPEAVPIGAEYSPRRHLLVK